MDAGPKILVTGCKGFIGSRLLDYLSRKGYRVTGTSQEIRDIDALRPFFKNIEFVIHTAGKKYNPIKEDDFYTINVLGTENVARLCLENNSKLIHLGSIATEEAYGISKLKSQQLVEEYSDKKGLKAIVLRLCVIYSKENNTGRRGARYPVEKLLEDIEKIILSHDFSKYELIDYQNVRV